MLDHRAVGQHKTSALQQENEGPEGSIATRPSDHRSVLPDG
ncbi:hypothetical protein [Streptomyces sp. NPDC088246]